VTSDEQPHIEEVRRIAGENFALLWGLLFEEIDRRIKEQVAVAVPQQVPPVGADTTTTPAVPEWCTLADVVKLSGRSYEYVRRAAVECQRTNGRSGLRSTQDRPHAKHMFHVRDVERWMHNQPPSRTTHKFRVVS
jgi:hypothetical protein